MRILHSIYLRATLQRAMGTTEYHPYFIATPERPTVAGNNWYHIAVHVYGSCFRGDPGGWRAQPIGDRKQQIRVFGYILKHQKQGATIWRFDR